MTSSNTFYTWYFIIKFIILIHIDVRRTSRIFIFAEDNIYVGMQESCNTQRRHYTQKMTFSVKDFFSKCDQIHRTPKNMTKDLFNNRLRAVKYCCIDAKLSILDICGGSWLRVWYLPWLFRPRKTEQYCYCQLLSLQ